MPDVPIVGTPPPLLPGVMRVAYSYTDGVADAVNVLHYLCQEAGGIDDSNIDAVAILIYDNWATAWMGHAATQWQITFADVVYAKIEGQPNVHRARVGDARAGQTAGTTEFANCSILLNWATGDPRRGGKARTYLPGMVDNQDADSAHLTTAVQNGVTTNFTQYLTAITGAFAGNFHVLNQVEYSEVLKNAYRASAALFPVSSVKCNPVVGSQRRRVGRLRNA